MKNKILLLVSLFLLSMPSYASFHCTVDVTRVLVYANGDVNVLHSGRGNFTVICNLNAPLNNVAVTTCAMWTSMLQSIQKADAQAIFYYSGTGTCAGIETYGSAPTPVYIGSI